MLEITYYCEMGLRVSNIYVSQFVPVFAARICKLNIAKSPID